MCLLHWRGLDFFPLFLRFTCIPFSGGSLCPRSGISQTAGCLPSSEFSPNERAALVDVSVHFHLCPSANPQTRPLMLHPRTWFWLAQIWSCLHAKSSRLFTQVQPLDFCLLPPWGIVRTHLSQRKREMLAIRRHSSRECDSDQKREGGLRCRETLRLTLLTEKWLELQPRWWFR